MQENKKKLKTEKELEEERKRKYKEELDLMIQFKMKNKENRNTVKPSFESQQKLELYEHLQKQEENYLKSLQKDSLKKSLLNQNQLKQNQVEKEKEERKHFNQQIQETLIHQRNELEHKRELKLQEVKECQHNYNEYINRKRQKVLDEEQIDKNYFEQEKHLRMKLENDNKEFLKKIRTERRRITNVIGTYQTLNNESVMRNKLIDQIVVEKGFLDKEAKELEKEKNELEKQNNLRNDVNQTLVAQIENNRIKREVLKYENLKLENEFLSKEMAIKKNLDTKQKLERQRVVQETMVTLEQQIKEREKRLLGDNYLTLNEEGYNCYINKQDGLHVCPEETANSIPGFCFQQDRKKMNEMADLSLQVNDIYLKNALANPKKYNLEKDRTSNRLGNILKMNYSPSCDNLNKTRRQFANEYEFLKYKNKYNNFNIINNKPCLI